MFAYAEEKSHTCVRKKRRETVADMHSTRQDLKRRIRKIPGVPIMSVAKGKYVIERLPDAPEKWEKASPDVISIFQENSIQPLETAAAQPYWKSETVATGGVTAACPAKSALAAVQWETVTCLKVAQLYRQLLCDCSSSPLHSFLIADQ
jgi:hypothetical protein